jgi:hypothetical protein
MQSKAEDTSFDDPLHLYKSKKHVAREPDMKRLFRPNASLA